MKMLNSSLVPHLSFGSNDGISKCIVKSMQETKNPLLFGVGYVILLCKEAAPAYAQRGDCDFRLVRFSF
jgi:hypothetical protein